MDDSRVKKASEILSRFFDDTTLQAATQFETFRSTWRQIVGQRLSDHSRPKSILHRTLLISADHAGWIQLLQLDRERILARISRRYPELEVASLAFTVEEPEIGASSVALPTKELERESSADSNGGREAVSEGPMAQPEQKLPLPGPLAEIFSRMRQRPGTGTKRAKGN